KALVRSETEFRAMFELAGVGQAQTDPITRVYTRVNRKFCELTGYSKAELLGMSFRDITHPDDRDGDERCFQKMLNEGLDHWFTAKRYVRKDGTVIHVEVNGTLLRDADGTPLRTLAVIKDVTVGKRALMALRESEERFRTAANTAPVMIWARDAQGRS